MAKSEPKCPLNMNGFVVAPQRTYHYRSHRTTNPNQLAPTISSHRPPTSPFLNKQPPTKLPPHIQTLSLQGINPSRPTRKIRLKSGKRKMATSILQRKRDFAYLVFFVIHLPVMLAFDLSTFYPASIKPVWMTTLREFYVATYGDRFFYNPPPYFPTLLTLELLIHLPLTLWAIPALLNNNPRTPLALLAFGLEMSITTLVCVAEMSSWAELSARQRGWRGLGGIFMTLDCYVRLDRMIMSRSREATSVGRRKKA
ncbi:hypothetical protein J1614_008124, partial [Plenodomus biglobosus]